MLLLNVTFLDFTFILRKRILFGSYPNIYIYISHSKFNVDTTRKSIITQRRSCTYKIPITNKITPNKHGTSKSRSSYQRKYKKNPVKTPKESKSSSTTTTSVSINRKASSPCVSQHKNLNPIKSKSPKKIKNVTKSNENDVTNYFAPVKINKVPHVQTNSTISTSKKSSFMQPITLKSTGYSKEDYILHKDICVPIPSSVYDQINDKYYSQKRKTSQIRHIIHYLMENVFVRKNIQLSLWFGL